MKRFKVKPQYDLFQDALDGVIYDVNCSLTKQQIEEKINEKIFKNLAHIRNDFGINEESPIRIEELKMEIYQRLFKTYKDILDLCCFSAGIVVNFMKNANAVQFNVLKHQTQTIFARTLKIYSVDEFINMLQVIKTKQLFLYEITIKKDIGFDCSTVQNINDIPFFLYVSFTTSQFECPFVVEDDDNVGRMQTIINNKIGRREN